MGSGLGASGQVVAARTVEGEGLVRRLHKAMEGWGTDTASLTRMLGGEGLARKGGRPKRGWLSPYSRLTLALLSPRRLGF